MRLRLQVPVWLCLVILGSKVCAYDLAFYHHYPDNVSICFHYGLSSLQSSVGPLSFKDVGYAQISSENAGGASFVYVDASVAGENCSTSSSSLLGAQRAPLQETGSNIFGLTAAPGNLQNFVLVAYRGGSAAPVSADQGVLRFSNEGFSECLAEIVVSGKKRSIVGRLSPGAGMQVSLSCDAAEQAPTALSFNCGGEVVMHEIANDGLGAVMCPGSTLQVSLVGRLELNGTFGPSVQLVSGSPCSCAERCRPSCAVASSERAMVSGLLMFLLLREAIM
mmetsp:Transcript_36632/g.85935  ORF Transcript_36632/g.85935 Transcript_36632/m.85935 type:complete len:278 (+) Transcript_36632:73-906(+)